MRDDSCAARRAARRRSCRASACRCSRRRRTRCRRSPRRPDPSSAAGRRPTVSVSPVAGSTRTISSSWLTPSPPPNTYADVPNRTAAVSCSAVGRTPSECAPPASATRSVGRGVGRGQPAEEDDPASAQRCVRRVLQRGGERRDPALGKAEGRAAQGGRRAATVAARRRRGRTDARRRGGRLRPATRARPPHDQPAASKRDTQHEDERTTSTATQPRRPYAARSPAQATSVPGGPSMLDRRAVTDIA